MADNEQLHRDLQYAFILATTFVLSVVLIEAVAARLG